MSLGDAVRAARRERAIAPHDRWPREALERHRAERIDTIVRHAAARSRFYAEHLAGRLGAGPVELEALPTLDKATMMERYDDIVCDRSLRRDELLAHVATTDGDALHRGRYRAMTTSGSSGLKGLFAYDRDGWAAVLAGFLRFTRIAGTTPRLPRRRVIAYVGPSGGTHMSRRIVSSLDIGLHRFAVLAATDGVPALVERLNAIRPDTLSGFPSMLALLADEQAAGRLRIRPSVVSTSSELRTPEMAAAMREAWGVEPFDLYALTEVGVLGAECERHQGIHVFEDLVAVEACDEAGRPVAPGDVGAQMLVTSLDNRLQPIIRLAVGDRVALDPEPCPCGRPYPLLHAAEGRRDDILALKGRDGRPVAVHPLQFAPVAQAGEVREFQVVEEEDGLRIRVALREGAAFEPLERRLAGELAERLGALGVARPVVRLDRCEAIERDPARMGKLQLVVARRPAAAQGSPTASTTSSQAPPSA